MTILPTVDGVLDSSDATYFLRPPFSASAPTPPIPPAGTAPVGTYRRPSQAFENYRREFGQADTP